MNLYGMKIKIHVQSTWDDDILGLETNTSEINWSWKCSMNNVEHNIESFFQICISFWNQAIFISGRNKFDSEKVGLQRLVAPLFWTLSDKILLYYYLVS